MLLVAGIAAAGVAVDALVGTHHLGHVTLLHQRLEGRQVGLPQVALRQLLDVEHVAVPLGTAVHGKVLGAGQQLGIFAGAQLLSVHGLPLQSVDHGQSHALGQVGVLAIRLLAASPAGVTEDVDVGRPERQPLIALHVARLLGLLVLGAGLVADGGKHVVQQLVVPRGRHLGGDGEHGDKAVAPHAVQGLVPPLEGGNAQPRNGGRHVHHQHGFLLNGQPTQQVLSPFLGREGRILKRVCLRHCSRRHTECQ